MMFMGEGCDGVWCVQRAVDFACVMNERASDEVALRVGGRCYLWPPKRPEKLPHRTSSSTVQHLKPPLSQMNLSSIESKHVGVQVCKSNCKLQISDTLSAKTSTCVCESMRSICMCLLLCACVCVDFNAFVSATHVSANKLQEVNVVLIQVLLNRRPLRFSPVTI